MLVTKSAIRPGSNFNRQGGSIFHQRQHTKLSRAEIRTTHITGIVTDIGIELGKLLYWNRLPDAPDAVRADRRRLAILSSLVACFFAGGLTGALGFKHLGYISTLPLALLLCAFAAVPMSDDLRKLWRVAH